MKSRLFCISILLVLLTACTSAPKDAISAGVKPPIYPDYADVTVPVNIAPLNFLVLGECQKAYAIASTPSSSITADCSGNEVAFNVKKWKKLLAEAAGDSISVTVWAKNGDKWTEYAPFSFFVSPDSIDSHLSYRLIEPDYEVFSRLQIMERNIENFDERPICDYNMVGNRCMNCHTPAANSSDLSFFYVRGPGGGMILNRGGELSKLDLRTPDMSAGSVYAQFSPSGRYLAFSTNVIIPAFHAKPSKRLEVFDTKSDVYVADLRDGVSIMRSPLLSDSARLETFPTFSPDGKWLYFCAADGLKRVSDVDSLQYSLCRIAFNEASGTFGESIDTLLVAKEGEKSSVCHPRVSPDGRFILYTVADYGTFPIWHPEADLQMMDLETGQILPLENVNSCKSDTYHSWSSSGRWFVFASKRDDGLYGKPYFAHVSPDGTASKPFVLPQRHPAYYLNTLKSFNTPELYTSPVPFKEVKL